MTRRLWVLAVAVGGIGCGDAIGPAHLEKIEIVSGQDQTGVELQPLPEPIVARALRSDGTPHLGSSVLVTIGSGQGSLRSGGAMASGNGAGVAGPANGTITVEWTLGPVSEEQFLIVSASEGADTVKAPVIATATVAGG